MLWTLTAELTDLDRFPRYRHLAPLTDPVGAADSRSRQVTADSTRKRPISGVNWWFASTLHTPSLAHPLPTANL